ncbi:MAG: arylesterase [Gammaproteobacteria bacterium]|nr:arylesterase [Gammaproteobacteria bacterium]
MLPSGISSVHAQLRALCVALVLLAGAPVAWPAESTIVVLGDSLSSGYGLSIDESWVSMLEERLRAEGYGYDVVNASISGDTSSGGLARLPALLAAHEPSIVIVELGGNDGLRGQPVQSLRANLSRIIELARDNGAALILTGIQIPPNYGPGYTGAFARIYPELAADFDIPLVGFLMEDVALNNDLMQSDGMHPNARGHEVMLENVWAVLADLL